MRRKGRLAARHRMRQLYHKSRNKKNRFCQADSHRVFRWVLQWTLEWVLTNYVIKKVEDGYRLGLTQWT